MKLGECVIGTVIYHPDYGVGHILGFELNVDLKFVDRAKMPTDEIVDRTCVKCQFPAEYKLQIVRAQTLSIWKD